MSHSNESAGRVNGSLESIARQLGGEISCGQILCPGPGHRSADRSLSVKLDPSNADGFVVHSFAGDDPIKCRDYVRERLGSSPWSPRQTQSDGGFNFAIKGLGHPTRQWIYKDADGQIDVIVARYDLPPDADGKPGKEFRPWYRAGGKWQSGQPRKEGRLLYRLPELIENVDAIVIVVEGEKAADAGARIFPGYYAFTTSINGSQSPAKSDWTPLVNRDVIIWPDHDDAGRKYAETVARIAEKAGAYSVRIVKIPAAFPAKWDLGDPLPDGVTCEDLATLIADAAEPGTADKAAKAAKSAKASSQIVGRRGGAIEPEPIEWLWDGRLALGKVSLIAGNPGLGKSQLVADMVARITTGRPWPLETSRRPVAECAILSAEDDPADTIRPRLDAAGADASKFHIIDFVRFADKEGQEQTRTFNLGADIAALDVFLEENPDIRFVSIDPISAYMGGVDTHKNADVRAVLAALSAMAGRRNVAVIGVTHLNKGGDGDAGAMMRISGSNAFVAAARAAFLIAKDRDDKSGLRRLFLPLKNNLAFDGGGLAYSIESVTLDNPKFPNGIPTSRIAWEPDPVTMTADEAVAPMDAEERSAIGEAKAFLQDALRDGRQPAKKLFRDAKAIGISEKTLRRAKADLNINSFKDGLNGGWVWELPSAEGGQGGQDSRPGNVATFAEFGHLRSTQDGGSNQSASNKGKYPDPD